MRDLQAAAPALGMQLHVLQASTDRDLDTAFAALGQLRGDALVIGPYLFFKSRIETACRTVAPPRGARYLHLSRSSSTAGGLMSYGADETETYRLVGIYTGKTGENPAVGSKRAKVG